VASFPMADAPAEVYETSGRSAWPLRLYVGRDEWGTDRWITLPGTTGITVGGLPMFGKTSLVMSWLCQLAASPAVQFCFVDGKGGGDYSPWCDRAWIYTGDNLPAAASSIEDVHSLMRARLYQAEQTGQRNWWRTGPTELRPLIVTVIDECHTFFDLEAVKGDRGAEAQVRACRSLTGQLVRKGRSVLFLTILVTQKQTSDAIPTSIRDNARLGLSFAVKTRDAAVAGLGEHIRQYESYCPTTLQDPAYVGVCTASLRTGHDPFVRLRVPEITEEAAEDRARQSQDAYHDPSAPPSTVPLVLAS
jgi:S-DNA-T family DNA segregation ATPase FtsK/SpoIIIE